MLGVFHFCCLSWGCRLVACISIDLESYGLVHTHVVWRCEQHYTLPIKPVLSDTCVLGIHIDNVRLRAYAWHWFVTTVTIGAALFFSVPLNGKPILTDSGL
jgi:hypothetical protein